MYFFIFASCEPLNVIILIIKVLYKYFSYHYRDHYFSYLENGVWDLKEVAVKKVTAKYTCCDPNYYNLEYRLVFHRHASFYISYILVPFILLSAIAMVVFFLPPDHSSKLQFSITNLLAMALFAQLTAEVVPHAGKHAPVMGKSVFAAAAAAVVVGLFLFQSRRSVLSYLSLTSKKLVLAH